MLLDRLFHVHDGVTVIFRDLTLQGGRAQDTGFSTGTAMGGAILSSSGIVTLEDVVVQQNQAVGAKGANGVDGGSGEDGFNGQNGKSAAGGGIAATGGSLTLLRTTLRDNLAQAGNGGSGGQGGNGSLTTSLNGGAGGSGGNGGSGVGGGLYSSNSTVSITDSLFAFNTARGGNGGPGGQGGDGFKLLAGGGAGGAGGNGGAGDVGVGGGLFFLTGGTLRNVTVSANSAIGGQGSTGGAGGLSYLGIPAAGGNGGDGGNGQGGGVGLNINADQAPLTSYNSTFTLNSGAGGTFGTGGSSGGSTGAAGTGVGGGVDVFGGTAGHRLFSTIVAGNTATTSPDFAGTLALASNNLIGDGTGSFGITNGTNGNLVGVPGNSIDPLLNLLADNGGPTLTHALSQVSPAINAGSNPDNLATDQRGFPRLSDGATDIGAYELFVPTPAPVAVPLAAAAPGITARVIHLKGRSVVRVFDAATGGLRRELKPFGTYSGKLQVLRIDVNGDGTVDLVVQARINKKLRKTVYNALDL